MNKVAEVLSLLACPLVKKSRSGIVSTEIGNWKKRSTYHVNEEGVLVEDGNSWNKWTTMDLFNGNLKFQSLHTQLPKIPFPVIPVVNEFVSDIDINGNEKIKLEDSGSGV